MPSHVVVSIRPLPPAVQLREIGLLDHRLVQKQFVGRVGLVPAQPVSRPKVNKRLFVTINTLRRGGLDTPFAMLRATRPPFVAQCKISAARLILFALLITPDDVRDFIASLNIRTVPRHRLCIVQQPVRKFIIPGFSSHPHQRSHIEAIRGR